MKFLDSAANTLRRENLRRGAMGVGAFGGAASDRLQKSWVTSNVSADLETRLDLRTLRGRNRQQARDNPWVKGMLWTLRANVHGPNGIIPQIRMREGGKWMDPTAPLEKRINSQLEAIWRAFCEDPDAVSVDGRTTFAEQAWFVDQTAFIDGEHFEFLDLGAANDFGFSVQTLDADQLDDSFNVGVLPNGNQIRMGIEVDSLYRPVAYHFWDRHPADLVGGVNVRKRVPADKIIHYYEGHRRAAVRGVPALTAAMRRLRMMDRLEEAELVASILSSSKGGVLKSNDIIAGAEEEFDADGNPKPQQVERELEPGLVWQLPAGWEYQPIDPQHPNSAFEPFQRAMLRAMGMSIGMSYASLSGDLTAVNYSSIRAGLLTERDIYRLKQAFAANHYHRRVFREVMRCAALRGLLPIPDERLPELFRSVTWQGRGWKWVDPINDMQALQLAIKLGVGSRTAACLETGIDFEENLSILRQEEELARDAGVSIAGEDSAGNALRPAPRHDGGSEDDDDLPPTKEKPGQSRRAE